MADIKVRTWRAPWDTMTVRRPEVSTEGTVSLRDTAVLYDGQAIVGRGGTGGSLPSDFALESASIVAYTDRYVLVLNELLDIIYVLDMSAPTDWVSDETGVTWTVNDFAAINSSQVLFATDVSATPIKQYSIGGAVLNVMAGIPTGEKFYVQIYGDRVYAARGTAATERHRVWYSTVGSSATYDSFFDVGLWSGDITAMKATSQALYIGSNGGLWRLVGNPATGNLTRVSTDPVRWLSVSGDVLYGFDKTGRPSAWNGSRWVNIAPPRLSYGGDWVVENAAIIAHPYADVLVILDNPNTHGVGTGEGMPIRMNGQWSIYEGVFADLVETTSSIGRIGFFNYTNGPGCVILPQPAVTGSGDIYFFNEVAHTGQGIPAGFTIYDDAALGDSVDNAVEFGTITDDDGGTLRILRVEVDIVPVDLEGFGVAQMTPDYRVVYRQRAEASDTGYDYEKEWSADRTEVNPHRVKTVKFPANRLDLDLVRALQFGLYDLRNVEVHEVRAYFIVEAPTDL